MSQGPFELWQQAGWKQVAEVDRRRHRAGKALSSAPLPAWVTDGRDGVHTRRARGARRRAARRALDAAGVRAPAVPRGRGRIGRHRTAGETAPSCSRTTRCASGRSTEGRDRQHHGQAAPISPTVAEGLKPLRDRRAGLRRSRGLVAGRRVLGRREPRGADAGVHEVRRQGHRARLKKFQDFMLRVRYAQVPVVSAVRGIALGGGCELAVYSAKRVAAMESYMGLVEVGVGLVPGAGGLTYIARRAAEMASAGNANADIQKFLIDGFTNAAMAKVGTGAIEAANSATCCGATSSCRTRTSCSSSPSSRRGDGRQRLARAGEEALPVAGRNGSRDFQRMLANMRDGGFISAHDFHIASLIADVVCGGDVDANAGERGIPDVAERKALLRAAGAPQDQERIMGMLSTGKPVRALTHPEAPAALRFEGRRWRPANRFRGGRLKRTRNFEHEADPGRLHRRRDAHRSVDRAAATSATPGPTTCSSRRSVTRWRRCRRWTRRRSGTRSSAARSPRASRA